MRNYRNLFEREFAADPRLFDIAGSGLPLGLKTLSPEAVFEALAAGEENPASGGPARGQAANGEESSAYGEPLAATNGITEKLKSFLKAEKGRLLALREMLSGGRAAQGMEAFIDECDYLWAHFPDYAGAGGRRPDKGEIAAGSPAAISFLKRLRAEIDPALALIERTLAETQAPT